MADIGLINDTTLTEIADAIRSKNGTTTKYKPSEMAAAIKSCVSTTQAADGGGLIERSITVLSNSNVTSIGEYAFYEWTTLKQADFAATTTVESHAFAGCENLISVNMPSVLTVDIGAFDGCMRLQSLNMPNVQSIGNGAFNECRSLQEAIFINLTEMGNTTFYNCMELQTVDMPLVTTLDGTFDHCSGLKNVNLPSVQTVGAYSFAYCTLLKEIVLPSVTSISNYAFSNCTNIVKIDLGAPAAVKNQTFAECTALEALIIRTSSMCTLSGTPFLNSSIESGTGYIYVPSAIINSYKVDTGWYAYKDQIRAIEDYPDICGGDA